MGMKLYAVRIFVRDWEAACRFYGEILDLPLRFRSDEAGWAEFEVGSACFGVERVDPDDAESAALVGRFVGASLEVKDIDSVYRDLSAKGVPFTHPPEKQFWGGTLAHFKDPDGNELTLLG